MDEEMLCVWRRVEEVAAVEMECAVVGVVVVGGVMTSVGPEPVHPVDRAGNR